MIDIETIRKNYSNMLDSQLINVAVQDGHTLHPAAFDILKEEFNRRQLDNAFIEAAAQRKIALQQEKLQEIRESSEEKYAMLLWDFVLEEKESGSADAQIINGLLDRGLEEAEAVNMLEGAADHVGQLISHYDTQKIIGGLVFFLGIFVTIFTYSMAKMNGGLYVLTWGAIVFGGIRFFKALSLQNKYRALLRKIS